MQSLKIYINYSGLGLIILALIFTTFEPAISVSATTADSQFTISQTVSKEVAITSAPANVTMSPSLGGLTGGTSTGTTTFAVTTNSLTGYSVTLTASSSLGMIGSASSSNYIPAYVPAATNVPDYNFTINPNKAYFGYTVQASSSGDVAAAFRENGSICNTGSTHNNPGHCWINASTTAFTIINRTLPTTTGAATSSITFQVVIRSNPSPIIPNDTYIATTTITATVN